MADEVERELTTWVCLTCGNEHYAATGHGARILCPQCGSAVFRPFDSPAPNDEVARDFLESTGGINAAPPSRRGRRRADGGGRQSAIGSKKPRQ